MLRFVDRDMLMRYHVGHGVGHVYAHGQATFEEDSQEEPQEEPHDLSDQGRDWCDEEDAFAPGEGDTSDLSEQDDEAPASSESDDSDDEFLAMEEMYGSR
jgi:hypothetical protein